MSTPNDRLVYNMELQFLSYILSTELKELFADASEARERGVGNRLEICGIVNAKSGRCSEDCKFCAQSAHYSTQIPEYPLKTAREIVDAARQAKDNGASRFGIVTSGNRLTPEDLETIRRAVRCIVKEVGIGACASLGALNREELLSLKEAGLTRYHHNIETSRRYYSRIVSTHTFDERISTIKISKDIGLEVCSGGIIGMGETWGDRLSMALLLSEMGVDAVPLNILVPIKGTPMGDVAPLSSEEALRSIALFRLVLKDKDIKVIAGRETVLKDLQEMMYAAGANGMMVGGYLTVGGRCIDDDKALIREIQKSWNKE